jgi:hypothetical protein
MGVRTDISEDPKGDPSKILPEQPEPGARREDVEPLLPKRHAGPRPPRARPQAQTPGDRRGLGERRRSKK